MGRASGSGWVGPTFQEQKEKTTKETRKGSERYMGVPREQKS